METKVFNHPHHRQTRYKPSGMALVLTVFILGMLTILVIGFLSSMMTEEKAATAYEQSQRTKLVAEGAVNHAIDILRSNIPEPARLSEGPAQAPAENWITNPGRLTILKKNEKTDKDEDPIHIPLHTGEATIAPIPGPLRDAESVDLNQPLPGETIPAITPAANASEPRPIMRVKWVNLLDDPSTLAGPNNRLSARYAFWMDDESTKLNFNTALGKPVPALDPDYANQFTQGFMPPVFKRGGETTSSNGSDRVYGLGKPESVNLDVLFSQPSQLLHDKRLSHTFLNGYYRYPEAIMDFINVPDSRSWYELNKFNLTFYNRSPDFNAFGRSRFYTSYIPLSLEGGPSYQQPFIYDPQSSSGVIIPKGIEGDLVSGTLASGLLKDEQILSLNSLMGFFGASAKITGPSGYEADQANMINRNQIRMLMEYMRRKWPGYDSSFVDKYGEMECYQIALNILQYARLATTQLPGDLDTFSPQWGARTTSVNFIPSSDNELDGFAPERFFWRFKDTAANKVKLMLPQMPGPYITEVRLLVESVVPNHPPKTDAVTPDSRYIQYWYEIETYMPPFGPVIDLAYYPTRMDYLEYSVNTMNTSSTGTAPTPSIAQFFGIRLGTESGRPDRTWQNKYMDLLATYPANDNVVYPPLNQIDQAKKTIIGPSNGRWNNVAVINRNVVESPRFTIGKAQNANGTRHFVSRRDDKIDKTNFPTDESLDEIWDPVVFDKRTTARITIKFRPGQGLKNAANRPRQMIPLGLTQNDTLQANFTLDLNLAGPQVISWQIADPRLSSDLSKWVRSTQGAPSATGTRGLQNSNEPAEGTNEKSKFRFVQRTPNNSTVNAFDYDRPDEYNTASRVSSPGYWSLLHTGMQGKGAGGTVPWRTLDFGPKSATNDPPDWLLLDIFGATYPMAHDQWKIDQKLPDSFSTASYMGSTAGQVNLNNRIYPRNEFFNPPDRTLPLKGVFRHLRSENQVNAFINNLTTYQTNDQVFDYVGELANVPNYEGTINKQWDKELYLRNMAGVLTTKSNTFGLWGVAQTVQKSSRNQIHDTYEAGDRVTGEKRFFALIERYVWAGRDGVPGNGHLSNGGTWDRRAQQAQNITTDDGITDTLFQLPGSPPLKRSADGVRLDLDATGTYPKYDGPESVGMDIYTSSALGSVEYSESSLEDAYNPPQAAIKYRVVYFKYLDQ